jgi:hypothetical protein
MNKYVCFSILLMCFSCRKQSQVAEVNCATENSLYDTAVLLVMGQSNAANAGDVLYTSICTNTYNFYNGDLYSLADPVKGANGDGGSVWSRLGALLAANGFAKTVIIAPAAVGGTSIKVWRPGGDLNYRIIETVHALQSKGLRITHVLWHQGESDNAFYFPQVTAATNANNYRRDFLSIVAQLRSLHVDAPVFPAIATRCGAVPADSFLQAAQYSLASDSLDIINGPNTDLIGNEYRRDDCHMNDQGMRIHAALWADILFAHR